MLAFIIKNNMNNTKIISTTCTITIFLGIEKQSCLTFSISFLDILDLSLAYKSKYLKILEQKYLSIKYMQLFLLFQVICTVQYEK